MDVCDKLVLKVSSDDYKFGLTWVDPSWGQWEEFVNDPEFKKLMKEAQDKLDMAKVYTDKGKGKGAFAA